MDKGFVQAVTLEGTALTRWPCPYERRGNLHTDPQTQEGPRDHRGRGWRDVATTSRTPGATKSWKRQAGPFLVPLPRPQAASLQHREETIPAVSAVWHGVTCSSCSKKWVWTSWRRDSSCPSGPRRGPGDGSHGLASMPMLHPSLWPRNLARARHRQARILDPVGRSVPA